MTKRLMVVIKSFGLSDTNFLEKLHCRLFREEMGHFISWSAV